MDKITLWMINYQQRDIDWEFIHTLAPKPTKIKRTLPFFDQYELVFNMRDNVKKIKKITIMTPSTLLYAGEVKVNDGPYISFRNEEAFYDTMDDICSNCNISLLKEWFYIAATELKITRMGEPVKLKTKAIVEGYNAITIDVSKSPQISNETQITIINRHTEWGPKKINGWIVGKDFIPNEAKIHTEDTGFINVRYYNDMLKYIEYLKGKHLTDVPLIQSWISEVKPWPPSSLGDKLVYDIGGPQLLEVHMACSIEVEGNPVHSPACVVFSGDTNFEFFENKVELFRILGVS